MKQPLQAKSKGFKKRGNKKSINQKTMKYDFIKQGNLLYWHDPDNGLSDGAYQVISAPEKVEDDSVILIASGSSEAEVSASELSPIRTGRNRKEDFQSWKGILECNL